MVRFYKRDTCGPVPQEWHRTVKPWPVGGRRLRDLGLKKSGQRMIADSRGSDVLGLKRKRKSGLLTSMTGWYWSFQGARPAVLICFGPSPWGPAQTDQDAARKQESETSYFRTDPVCADCSGAAELREHRDTGTGRRAFSAVADMSKDFLSYLADGRDRLGARGTAQEEESAATRESRRDLSASNAIMGRHRSTRPRRRRCHWRCSRGRRDVAARGRLASSIFRHAQHGRLATISNTTRASCLMASQQALGVPPPTLHAPEDASVARMTQRPRHTAARGLAQVTSGPCSWPPLALALAHLAQHQKRSLRCRHTARRCDGISKEPSDMICLPGRPCPARQLHNQQHLRPDPHENAARQLSIQPKQPIVRIATWYYVGC